MGMRARTSGRRPITMGAMVAVLCSVVSCSASAGLPQRVEQGASPATTTSTAPPAPAVAAGPTQMWIDAAAIDEETVIVRTGLRLAVFDASTLAARWQRDRAVLSADRRTAVASVPATSGQGTTVEVVDARTGAIRRTIALDQTREVVAVSASGQRAALVDPLTLDPATGMPVGRERSMVDVVDLTTGATVAKLELDGNFVPEAFDHYGGVAIIQYVPAAKPARYRVRTLDVKSGKVTNVLTRDKTEIVDEMQGYGRAAIAKADGSALFTLYRDGGRWGSAFVHQLVGEGQFAFCIDLPETGFDDASTIALSPDDRELYVAGAKGAVAVIDARENFGPLPVAVQKVLWVPGVVGTPTAMAVTGDTVWLLVDGQLVVANRATGERVTAHPAAGATGVGVSADGRLQLVADDASGVRRV